MLRALGTLALVHGGRLHVRGEGHGVDVGRQGRVLRRHDALLRLLGRSLHGLHLAHLLLLLLHVPRHLSLLLRNIHLRVRAGPPQLHVLL